MKRGAAVLALLRLLSEKRPVSLWLGTSLGTGGNSKFNDMGTVLFPVETAPLDLARSAFALCHASVSRAMCYGISRLDINSNGQWPYDSERSSRLYMHKSISRLFPDTDVMVINSAHIDDPLLGDPAKWLADMLAIYGKPADELVEG